MTRAIVPKATTPVRPVNARRSLSKPAVLRHGVRWVINLMLIAAMAHSVVRLTWRLTPEQGLAARSLANIASSIGDRPAPPGVQIAQIRSAHLFGFRGHEAHERMMPTIARTAPPNLHLQGLLYAVAPGDSRAIIAVLGRGQSAYAAGSHLPGGATIVRIYRDRVLLSHDRRYEMLYLTKEGKHLRRGPAP